MSTRNALCFATVILAGPLHADAVTLDRAACVELENLSPAAFTRLTVQLEAEHWEASGASGGRLAACDLKYPALLERQCGRAYNRQHLEFLLQHCRDAAWSLARAQCERNLDSIAPRYAAFCRAFGRE